MGTSSSTTIWRYKQLMEAYDNLMKHGRAPAENTKFTEDEERQRMFQQQLIDRLTNTPGVVAVGTINYLPLSGGGPDGNFLINNDLALQAADGSLRQLDEARSGSGGKHEVFGRRRTPATVPATTHRPVD